MPKDIEKIIDKISFILIKNYKTNKDNSLFGGTSGILLYFFYLYQSTQENKWRKVCINLIKRHIIDLQTNYFNGYTLESGAVGICWVLLHIQNENDTIFESGDIEDVISFLDDFIIEECLNDFQNECYDLLHGPLGALFYFLERKKQSQKIQKFYQQAVNFFEKSQDICGAWPVKNERLKKQNDGEATVFDLGLSHGNPSALQTK